MTGDIATMQAKLDFITQALDDIRARLDAPRGDIPADPLATLWKLGYHRDQMYAGFIGGNQPVMREPQPVPLTSAVCRQAHFSLDQFRFWIRAIKQTPGYHRKQWEYFYVMQALFERGLLAKGRRGLGFGVGQEPLPALFASFGVEVVASDQSLEGAIRAGWAKSGEHSIDLSALNTQGLCTDYMFEKLVTFCEIDMNAIDRKWDSAFDFCWSCCSLEHLGSLEHGIEFIVNSMNVLKPGGAAVHTTEYNLSSNDKTIESRDLSIYRRQDIERLFARLTDRGFRPSEMDYSAGEGFADLVVDLPPFDSAGPHLRLRLHEFDCTSVGVIVQKSA